MMIEGQIIHKLKLDIEEKERSYQKELQKIKAENELLAYIKGMLDITEGNVSNFPYYDSNDLDTKEAEEDFNVMLKYTLKEDCIIDSFSSGNGHSRTFFLSFLLSDGSSIFNSANFAIFCIV